MVPGFPMTVVTRLSTFVNTIATKTRLPVQQVVEWCGLARGKFYDWRKRYGKVNEHNGLVPRDHWIEDWERQRVIDYFDCHPLDGVSATDVHDAGRRGGGLEPIDDVPCVVEGGSSGPLEREAVEEGNGLRSAGASAPTLAYGYLVLESGRDVLLPVLVSGWCESGGGSLGDTRVDDGSGCGVHLGASEGAVPGCAASNHLGQRSSVHREGLQDVHPHLRDDAREDGAVLPAIERKDRTLAQDDKIGCPASCQPLEPRRGLAD